MCSRTLHAERYVVQALALKMSTGLHSVTERTFLAWLRTSLSFASIGIAVTQLFRLNTSITTPDGQEVHLFADTGESLRQVGKPLGATFIGICELDSLLSTIREYRFLMIRSYLDLAARLPPLLRKPALCHSRQVPSLTRDGDYCEHCGCLPDRRQSDRGRCHCALGI